jgi:hypothetical protein
MPTIVADSLSLEQFNRLRIFDNAAPDAEEGADLATAYLEDMPFPASASPIISGAASSSSSSTSNSGAQLDPRLANQPWLTRFPNTAFGIVLGLGGHAGLWKTLAATPFMRDAVNANAVNEFFFFAG